MYQVYILKSEIQTRYYIGHSHNLAERLETHNRGAVRSTKAYRSWKIVYTELCESKQEAYKRELQIKSYKGGEAFKKLIV
ncbi:MAG: endonuclease [Candidatus Moranbacteria bacterium RIFCSPHIGHO2_12_FULL_54_9]|nr:MAG: endonuclease [Candidatus Moranbacteria bacterium RIFCSPHIGHO2_12_FULL_54_9]